MEQVQRSSFVYGKSVSEKISASGRYFFVYFNVCYSGENKM